MNTLNGIKAELSQFYGTNQYYKGLNGRAIYTDGIKELLNLAECYWLYDIIQTEVFGALVTKTPDTFYLKLNKPADTNGMNLILEDWAGAVIWKKEIGLTTFPAGEMTLCCGFDGQHLITCLMSER